MKNKLAKLKESIKANKKKIIVVVSMVALLVATGCLNYFLNVKQQADQSAGTDGGTVTAESFFSTYRTDREETRSQELQYLDEIIASASSSESAIASAEEQKLLITGAMETELVLEGLIKAKGFKDCVVTMSTENVNVVVMDEELTLEESAQILDIIVSETDYTAPNVVIIPYV